MYSSLHIGLCAVSYTLFGYWIFSAEPDFAYVTCVGCATVGLYSLHRLIGIAKVRAFEHEGRFRIIKLYKNHIWVYFFLSAILCLISFYFLPFKLKLFLIIPEIISLGYALPLFGGKRIRDFDFIKIVLIALIWTVLCIVIPGLSEDVISSNLLLVDIIFYSLASFLFFIGITLPFDVRDRVVDSNIGVATFATRLGESKSLLISKLLISISILMFGFGSYMQDSWSALGIWTIVCVLTIGIINKYRADRPDWYYSFALDGTIGLFFILKVLAVYMGVLS